MKSYVRFAAASAIGFALLVSMGMPATAADKIQAPVIMVVDIPKVLNECKQTKKIKDTRQSFTDKYNKEFDVEGVKLRDEEKQLNDQRTLLSPEAFVEKQKAFAAKAGAFEKRTRIRSLSLDAATDSAMKQLGSHMSRLVRELANETGANIVLSRTQVEYFDPSMDKTDVLLDRVNSKVKEITFPNPLEVEKELQSRIDTETAKRQQNASGKDSKDSKKK